MNKEVLLMYSGGLDSILSCIRLINEGYKVYLIHYDNSSSIGTENIQMGFQKLKNRYKEKLEFIGIAPTIGIIRNYRTFNDIENTPLDELSNKYGKINISQYRCLLCRMAMYSYSIKQAKQLDIKYIAEGARESQLFAIEQKELLDEFKKLCQEYGIELLLPVFDVTDDFLRDNEIIRNEVEPIAYESKCLLGYPMNRPLNKNEIEDIRDLYKQIYQLQKNDIDNNQFVLKKHSKNKITWN